jgi:DNA repair protein RecO (recombination protein O)
VATYREQGIVLRTWKLGEADRIVNLFTQGRGKVRAVVKGVRRTGSRIGGRLEPFTHVDLQLYEGRNLDVVNQAETIAAHGRIRDDYGRSMAANVLVEVVDALAQEGTQDLPLFLLLRAGLQALDAEPPDPSVFVDAFLLRATGVAGFPVHLDACAGCRAVGEHRHLSVNRGGVLCSDCASIGARAIDAGSLDRVRTLATGSWVALPALADGTDAQRTASSFARVYAEHHLGIRLRAWDLIPR